MSELIDRVSSPVSALEVSLSFDDVLLLPGQSSVLPSECDVSTNLSRLKLRIPMLSSAMDTVTEAQTAIAMALMGGIGVLHRNCSAEEQAKMVRRVKKFQHAVIASPITVKPSQTIGEVHELIEETGVTGFPVVDENGVLVGMCTGRDIRYVITPSTRVGEIMSTPALSLPLGATRLEAEDFFRRYKLEKLPLVDAQGRLGGLITSRDWRESKSHPDAVRDEQGSLMVAAAIGVGDEALERAAAQVEAGVDMLVIDSAHGHSDGVLRTIAAIRSRFPSLLLSGGNIATAEGALALAEAGVDIVKVGMGPGSICTTRVVSGVGVAQFSAVLEVTHALRSAFPQVAIVADGGIRYSGDITKALAAGADAVMIGGLFAGTDEAPGELVLFQGRSYKTYRGMGSLAAMRKGGRDRYGQAGIAEASKLVPEGVEARVPYRGPLGSVVSQLIGGLRAGMGYVGAASLDALRKRAKFRRITAFGLRESHVHDVTITAEAPNYSGTFED
ncbi:MAG: IMP dehydrogenase [Myxococcales bacterium]|nr:IMP dehydrogenase [Myxococcales bacterium]